jgi:hypothetical protein
MTTLVIGIIFFCFGITFTAYKIDKKLRNRLNN